MKRACSWRETPADQLDLSITRTHKNPDQSLGPDFLLVYVCTYGYYLPAFMRLMALIKAWMDAVMISVSMPAPQVMWPSSFVMPM